MRNLPIGFSLLSIAAIAGCSLSSSPSTPVGADPAEAGGKADSIGASSLPEVTCGDDPQTGPKSWRHPHNSPITTSDGDALHRGIDLITSADAATQTIEGQIRYGHLIDDPLKDEGVDLFACREGAWQSLGSSITDNDGHFALALTGDARLPLGMRDMFVSVQGDRTSARFLALVAPTGTEIAFSDCDGTLTSSENAYPDSLLTGATVGANEGAANALITLRQRNYLVVYLTARALYFTQDTRDWLWQNGFPMGPLRFAPGIIFSSSSTADYKASSIATIAATGLVPKIGIGNRATDEQAYSREHIDGENIFLKMPEFESECADLFTQGKAVSVTSYVDITPTFAEMPVAP